jgi:pimeloyl-ACP methyl ester carboxylesterase
MAMLARDDGAHIYFETHGSGPAILLTHGYSCSSHMWAGQIGELSKDHTLIVWDMRGHGQSDAGDDLSRYSEAATVADMAALLDHHDADTAVVGGLSLGGYMSLAFHRAHPARVKALLIIDTGPGFRNDAARDGWNQNALKTAQRFEDQGFDALRGAETRTSRHRSAKGLALAGRGMLTQRDAGVINSLPDVRKPALVLVGANDTPFLNAANYMAAKIPNAEKVAIPEAGHAANIDQPAAFNAAVRAFLTRNQL